MKYLITGGAGFIGREIVKQLLIEETNEILVYDDFSFGKRENIEEFLDCKRLHLVENTIVDSNKLRSVVQSFKPEIVIHLAALHFIPFCNEFPLKTAEVNVMGTYAIFESLRDLPVKKLLFASSGAIYKSEIHPLSEEKDLPEPVDNYGLSKFLGEKIAEYYTKKLKISCVVMRFFNTYGPFETNEHLLPEIIRQLKEANVLQLGNIKTKRDYIFTEDIAKAIIGLSKSSNLNEFEIVNIGSGIEYSADEIVDYLSELLGKTITIEVDSSRLRKSDKMHQFADLRKIHDLISWKPEHSLKDGLKKLLIHEKLI